MQVVQSLVQKLRDGRRIDAALKTAAWRSIRHCQDMVDNVTDRSKLKRGTIVLAQETFSLYELCEGVGLTIGPAGGHWQVECKHTFIFLKISFKF